MNRNSCDVIERLRSALEAISNDANRLLDDEDGQDWDVDVWEVIAGIRSVTDEALDDCGFIESVYSRKGKSTNETND